MDGCREKKSLKQKLIHWKKIRYQNQDQVLLRQTMEKNSKQKFYWTFKHKQY